MLTLTTWRKWNLHWIGPPLRYTHLQLLNSSFQSSFDNTTHTRERSLVILSEKCNFLFENLMGQAYQLVLLTQQQGNNKMMREL